MEQYTTITPYLAPRPQRVTLTVVGCGGTGGWLVENLATLAYDLKRFAINVVILLIDGDRVEERNLGRQNFYPNDIKKNKALVLAQRYGLRFGVPIGHIPKMATQRRLLQVGRQLGPGFHILLGAVDRPEARRAMFRIFRQPAEHRPWHVWIESGNTFDGGDIVVGTTGLLQDLRGTFLRSGICKHLPVAPLIYPNLLEGGPAKLRDDCANAMLRGEQSLTINRSQAMHMLEIVNALLYEHKLSYWQVASNYKGQASVTSVPITPMEVAKYVYRDIGRARQLLADPPPGPRGRALRRALMERRA